jgi:selenide,water dikinase
LVVLGLVHPSKVKRNDSAQAGDKLILGKGLGVGILSAALKKGLLNEAGYATMIATTTQLNKPGAALATMSGIGAVTDVTGFGLLGHLLEVARGSGLSAQLSMSTIPLLDQTMDLAIHGAITGASGRNWSAYGNDVKLSDDLNLTHQHILCDPQTSGGLLVSARPDAVDAVLKLFHESGFRQAGVIGEFVSAGTHSVTVTS